MAAAEVSGRELKSTYPMLQIEIYDAAKKIRALLSWSIRRSQPHHREGSMALLKRELYRQVKGPEITHADRCSLVFDTDSKKLYVEREIAHLEVSVDGTVDYQTATMDIADYLTQGGQTAGHRELWRLLRTLFNEHSGPESED
jgi:hypothetical protein